MIIQRQTPKFEIKTKKDIKKKPHLKKEEKSPDKGDLVQIGSFDFSASSGGSLPSESQNIAVVSPSPSKKTKPYSVPVTISSVDFDNGGNTFSLPTGLTAKTDIFPALKEPEEFFIAGDMGGQGYSYTMSEGFNLPPDLKNITFSGMKMKKEDVSSSKGLPQTEGALFEKVQLEDVFGDSKTFVDSVPNRDSSAIMADYEALKNNPDFNVKDFVKANFSVPESSDQKPDFPPAPTMEKQIDQLWDFLTREPDKVDKNSSLIPLKHPYIVPGGRFGEIYYWDSYFTSEGLANSGKMDMAENMTKNFADIIDQYGHVPNGNRKYYLSRSQPPFFTCMVDLIAKKKGVGEALKYLPQVEKEYDFWMDGADKVTENNPEHRRVVRMEDGSVLNRFWDDKSTAREESYKEDVEIAEGLTDKQKEKKFRDLRAGGESGWDFTTRWFKDNKSLDTIRTTEITPIDLNCELYNMETKLADWNEAKGDTVKAKKYREAAENRKNAIQKFCWNEEKGFYFDYCHTDKEQTQTWSLAAATPLYFGVAEQGQSDKVVKNLKDKFLVKGGLKTTLSDESTQQWDGKNVWAPLVRMAEQGTRKYGHDTFANNVADRFLHATDSVYKQEGKLMEKYNGEEPTTIAGGGEYEIQEGFGWTNGVTITLLKEKEEREKKQNLSLENSHLSL